MEKRWYSLDIELDGRVQVIYIYENKLFVGGKFNISNSSGYNIAEYDLNTNQWRDWGSNSPSGFIRTIAASKEEIFIGGDFSINGFLYHQKWGETNWRRLRSPYSEVVINTMKVKSGKLAIGGVFQFGSQGDMNLAVFDLNTRQWTNPDDGVENKVNTLDFVNDNEVVFAQNGQSKSIKQGGSNIMVYNITSKTIRPLTNGGTNGDVHSIEVQGNNMYVCGIFTRMGGQPSYSGMVQYNFNNDKWIEINKIFRDGNPKLFYKCRADEHTSHYPICE
jgi:hypothetical protein